MLWTCLDRGREPHGGRRPLLDSQESPASASEHGSSGYREVIARGRSVTRSATSSGPASARPSASESLRATRETTPWIWTGGSLAFPYS